MATLMPTFHTPLLWCLELPQENSCSDKDYISWTPLPLGGAMWWVFTISRAKGVKNYVCLLPSLSWLNAEDSKALQAPQPGGLALGSHANNK